MTNILTIEEILTIAIYGTEEEKRTLLACMIHYTNMQLENFEKTLREMGKINDRKVKMI